MKKLLNKLTCGFAMMLLVAGASCFVPTLFKGGQTNALAGDGSGTGKELWSSTQMDLGTTNFNGEQVYTISSASDLAYMSLKIAEGEASFASASYVVTTNQIDLGGKLWTPIGNPLTPFTGKFYGNHVVVDGIWVTEESVPKNSDGSALDGSGFGLFGNVGEGAIISDVNVEGFESIPESEGRSGVLVGYIENAKITNCHDLRKDTTSIPTISGASSAKVYFGASIDGESVSFTSAAEARTSISYNGVSEGGFVATYKLPADAENATFKYSSLPEDEKCKLINVAVDESLNVLTNGDEIAITDANNFSATIPTLRKDGTDFYVLNPGYKAVIPQLSWQSGLISNITFENPPAAITVNYGYGSPTTVTKQITGYYYDMQVKDMLAQEDISRPGFIFEGIYSDSGFTSDANENYIDDQPKTLFTKWAATQVNAKVSLGISDTDGNNMAKGEGDWANRGLDILNSNENGFTYVDKKDDGAVNEISNIEATNREAEGVFATYHIINHITDNTMVFTVKLKDGFQIPTTENFVAADKNAFDKVGDAVIENAGIYITWTDDEKNPPIYKVERDSNNIYTITIKNIVKNDAIVNIIIERREVEITFDRTGDTQQINYNTQNTHSITDGKIVIKAGDIFGFIASTNDYFFFANPAVTPAGGVLWQPTTSLVPGQKFYKTTTISLSAYSSDFGHFLPIIERNEQGEETNLVNGTIKLNVKLHVQAVQVLFDVELDDSIVDYKDGDYTKNYVGLSTSTDELGTTKGQVQVNVTSDGMLLYLTNNLYYKYKANSFKVYVNDVISTTAHVDVKAIDLTAEGFSATKFTITNLEYDEKTDVVKVVYSLTAIDYQVSQEATLNGETFANKDAFLSMSISGGKDSFYIGENITYSYTVNDALGKLIYLNSVSVNGVLASKPEISGNTYTGLYTFSVVEGQKPTKINIVADFKVYEITLNFLANEARLGEKDITGNLQNAGQMAVVLNSGNTNLTIANLTSYIFNQNYYGYNFTGWYLQNGETVTVDEGIFAGLLAYVEDNSKLLANVSENTTINVKPIYTSKMITVSTHHKAGENEEILTSDGGTTWGHLSATTNQIAYSHDMDASQKLDNLVENFRKAGFDVASSWILTGGRGLSVSIIDGKVSINISADFHASWSEEETGKNVELVPNFDNKLSYIVNLASENNNEKFTVSLGDTITLDESKFTSGEQTFMTTKKNGYRVSGFSLSQGKTETSVQIENNIASIEIDESTFISFIETSKYLSNNAEIFTLTTDYTARNYSITLGFDNRFESVADESQLSATVTFGDKVESLSAFIGNISRPGFVLVGFKELSGTTYATLNADGEWTYKEFTPTVADDTFVYAIWEREENYSYTEVILEAFSPFYNGSSQVVATATVKAGGEAVDVAAGKTFANGETIQEFTFDGRANVNVSRTDVNSESLVFSITLRDSLASVRGYTSTNKVISKNVTSGVQANEIKVEEGSLNLTSFYTGTEELSLTDGEQNYGNIVFKNDVSVAPVVGQLEYKVVDEAGAFNAGSSYKVKVSTTLTDTMAKNFGFTLNTADNKYEIGTIENAVTIIPFNVVFNIAPNQKAFVIDGQKHIIKLLDDTTPDNVTVEKGILMTSSHAAGVYNNSNLSVADFENGTIKVSLNGKEVSAQNYSISFSGAYEIQTFEGATHLVSPRYLTAQNGDLLLNNGQLPVMNGKGNWSFENISFIYKGQQHSISEKQYTFAPDGNLVFTMIANNDGNLEIALANGENVTFEISLSMSNLAENLKFIEFADKTSIISGNEYIGKLNTFTSEASATVTIDFDSTAKEVFAVFSDARRVNIFNNIDNELITDKTASNDHFFIAAGDSYAYTTLPTKTNFTFDSFKVDEESGVTLADTTFANTTGATPVNAIILWSLNPINVNTIKNEIIYSHTFICGFLTYNLNMSEIFETTSILSNDISSKLTIYKLGDGDEKTFISEITNGTYRFNRDKDAEGNYVIEIIYTYTNVNGTGKTFTQNAEVKFKLTMDYHLVTGLKIDSNIVYAGKDLKNMIGFYMTYYENYLTEQFLNEDLNQGTVNDAVIGFEGHSVFKLAVEKKNSAGEFEETKDIINAGVYRLKYTLVNSDSGYKLGAITQEGNSKAVEFVNVLYSNEVIVGKFDYTIKDSDMLNEDGSYKLSSFAGYSLEEPFKATVWVEDTNENMELEFVKGEGFDASNVGLYNVRLGDKVFENYEFAIDEANKYYQIKQVTQEISIQVDDASVLNKKYNGLGVNIKAEFNETGNKWELIFSDTEEIARTSLTLKIAEAGGYQDLPFDAELSEVFNNVTFSFGETVKDAKSYLIRINANVGGDSTFQAYSFHTATYFTINKKDVTVESVTKSFDNTNAFGNAVLSGVVGDEKVTITGVYENVSAGQNKALKNVQLDPTNEVNKNYVLSEVGNVGEITPASNNVKLDFNEYSSFEYGNFKEGMTLDEIKALLGNEIITGQFEDDNAFTLAFKEFVGENIFSTGKFLKVGEQSFVLTLTSGNYETLKNGKDFTFSVTIDPKEIVVSANKDISKQYDSFTDLPSDVTISLDGVLTGDAVAISTKAYSSAAVGENIAITIALAGDDFENYDLTNELKGTILPAEVKIKIDAKSGLAGFESITSNDGESLSFEEKIITFDYDPAKGNDENYLSSIIAGLSLPTRKGFSVTGFTFESAELTEENIQSVLAKAFEASDKTATIVVGWSQDNVTITLDAEGFEIEEETIIIPYFSGTTNISFAAAQGMKLASATITNGSAQLSGLDEAKDKRRGTLTLSNVKDNITLTLVQTDIIVSVSYNDNKPDLASSITVNGWTGTKEVAYNELKTQKVSDFMPTLTAPADTYDFAGWKKGYDKVDEKTFAEIFAENDPSENVSFEFTATWQGVNYTINFIKDGAVEETINAIFGEAINQDFPALNEAGKTLTWNTAPDGIGGQVYKKGDRLETIRSGSKLDLYAVYINNEYTLQISILSTKVTVMLGDKKVNSNDEFTVKYGSQPLSFSVTTVDGYSYTVETNGTATVKDSNGKVEVSDLTQNTNLIFDAEANDNTLTITLADASVTSSNADYDEATGKYTITAKTDETVTFTVAPNKGYTLANAIFSGANIETSFDATSDVMTVTWSGFTASGSFELKAVGKTINFSVEGSLVQTFNVSNNQTGKTAIVTVTAVYGYQNITAQYVGTENGVVITKGNERINDGLYIQEFEVTGFTEDVILNITATAREYTFKAISGGNGSVSIEGSESDEITVSYGETITLNVLADASYIFKNWTNNGVEVSMAQTSEGYQLTLEASQKSLLENVEGGKIVLQANFTLSTKSVTIKANGFGSVEYAGEIVGGGNAHTFSINIDSEVTFRLVPNNGYESAFKFMKGETEVAFTDYEKTTVTENFLSVTYITFTMPANFEADTFEVEFKPGQAIVTVQAVLSMDGAESVPNATGGKVYIYEKNDKVTDENRYGNLLTGTPAVMGESYTVSSTTAATLQFVAYVREGYDFVFTADNSSISTEKLDVVEEGGETFTRYIATIPYVRNGIVLKGIFIAKSNKLSVKFQQGEADANAGYIYFEPNKGDAISVENNNTSNAIVTIKTGVEKDFDISIRTNFNYSFAKTESGDLDISIVKNVNEDGSDLNYSISEIVREEESYKNGYLEQVTLKINGEIKANYQIIIKVVPKKYKVKFINKENEKDTEVASVIVGYGEEINLNETVGDRTLEEIFKDLKKKRSEASFDGFYTFDLGGTQYISGEPRTLKPWAERGYNEISGGVFEQSDNFTPPLEGDDHDGTFTLYARWIYNKEKVSIDFIPPELKEKSNVDVTDIITGMSSEAFWTNSQDKFYAEIKTGTEINLVAYNFEGYTFKEWRIFRNGVLEETVNTPNYLYTCQSGDVTIEAVYFVNFNLSVKDNEGGSVSLRQDGVDLRSAGNFDSTKDFLLVATANPGYTFVGWKYPNGENFGEGTKTSENGLDVWVLPVSALSEPLNLVAVFKGNPIDVVIDMTKATEDGIKRIEIAQVFVGDKEVENFDGTFNANVGEIITVIARANYGYGINWEGAIFNKEGETEDGYSVFKYKVLEKDFIKLNDQDTIVIKPVADKTELKFIFELKIDNGTILNEKPGTITHNGREIVSGSVVEGLRYGDVLTLKVNLAKNYDINTVSIKTLMLNDLDYATTGSGFNKTQSEIVIQTSILGEFELKPDMANSIMIIIKFQRNNWLADRSENLEGAGIETEPYLISSEKDLAFFAYMVNVENNSEYANAHYRLTKNLNLSGKFWEPIGTQETPFNGVFDMGKFKIENIEHYQTYVDPSTSYGGLFRYLGSKAKVLTSDNTLLIALCSAGGALVLILLIILIIILSRKAKKKKMDELANS